MHNNDYRSNMILVAEDLVYNFLHELMHNSTYKYFFLMFSNLSKLFCIVLQYNSILQIFFFIKLIVIRYLSRVQIFFRK